MKSTMLFTLDTSSLLVTAWILTMMATPTTAFVMTPQPGATMIGRAPIHHAGNGRYSDFLYPADPTDRKNDSPALRKAGPSIPQQQPQSGGSSMANGADSFGQQGGDSNENVYEDEELSTDELREQVERLLQEEEEAERVERERLLTMRAQLLERKRKREQQQQDNTL